MVEHKIKPIRKKRVDYALFYQGEIVAFIEAKRYGTFGSKKNENNILKTANQVANYRLLNGKTAPLGIVTDGGCWCIYDLRKRGTRKYMAYFDLDIY